MASKARRAPRNAAPDTSHSTQGRRRKAQTERVSSKRSDLRYKEIRHLLARKEREKREHAETLIEEL